MLRPILVALILGSLVVLPSCKTNPNRSPSETMLFGTGAGAGAGALVGYAAGDTGTGAAVGAIFGFLVSAMQSDEDRRERVRIENEETQPRVTVIKRRRVKTVEDTAPREGDPRDQAYDLLYRAQRSSDPVAAESLLKRSLTAYRTPEAHTALGELYESQGDKIEAEGEYRRALDLDPEYRPARGNLSRVTRS